MTPTKGQSCHQRASPAAAACYTASMPVAPALPPLPGRCWLLVAALLAAASWSSRAHSRGTTSSSEGRSSFSSAQHSLRRQQNEPWAR